MKKTLIISLIGLLFLVSGCVQLTTERLQEYMEDEEIKNELREQILNISESLCYNVTMFQEGNSTKYTIETYICQKQWIRK